MKLSEILAADEKNADAFHFGVEVDVESFSPPPGLKEIAFVWAGTGTDIDVALMDAIISYRLAGVEVILEIPHDAEGLDVPYLVAVAANSGFSIALVPPKEDAAETREAYGKILGDFAKAFFGQPNVTKAIHPISGYLEYLFAEALAGPEIAGSQPVTDDPYVRARWIDAVSPEFADDFKSRLRSVIHETFGGEEPFRTFARRLAGGICRQAENTARGMLDDATNEMQASEERKKAWLAEKGMIEGVDPNAEK
jgi:hypothetical protein